jgi:hypothetical protein
VSADRAVSVSVADDSDALLSLDAKSSNENSAYADESGNQITIDLSSSNSTSAGGDGINQDATTEIFDVFDIENQGTQNVLAYVPPSSVGNQGGFDRTDDGLYFDPQVTNMPNGINHPDAAYARLPDGTPYTSLTNIGGTILDNGSTFGEATIDSVGSELADSVGTNPPEIYLLRPGESFEFGMYLDATDSATGSFQYDISIKADADLAEAAGLGSV